LILALPSFLINIFSSEHYRYQRDIFHNYAALLVPGIFIAGILAVGSLADGTHPLYRLVPRLRSIRLTVRTDIIAAGLVIIMLAFSLFQFGYTKPNKIGEWAKYHGTIPPAEASRAASADVLIAMIPNDAPLSVTNLLATRVPLRRYLYFFPGQEFYDAALIDKADYVLGDLRAGKGSEAGDLNALLANGQWQLVKRQGDFELLHRIAPPTGRAR
jgi:hypothetical protein